MNTHYRQQAANREARRAWVERSYQYGYQPRSKPSLAWDAVWVVLVALGGLYLLLKAVAAIVEG